MIRDRDAGGSGSDSPKLKLNSGSRVAVIGGAPAGSFFSYFLLDVAQRAGLDLHVDIYEPRDFTQPAPQGCNMCGGIISESLVQMLAAEGITLPAAVVQRGIDSYVLHTEEGNVSIQTPLHEKRIAAVHRGAGPRGIKELKWRSLDGYLLELASAKGAQVVRERVERVDWQDGRPQLTTRHGVSDFYDFLAVAVGVNTNALKLFEDLGIGYAAPRTTRTHIREFYLGQELIEKHLGNSMHVFLLKIPRLEFAALIPKGDYATLCLLGEEIDGPMVQAFLDAPEIRECLPPSWSIPRDSCHCAPRISIRGAEQPFADRMVFIGDCGVTRLYKDGIGAAYRTAKAAAVTAVFEGIGAEDFRRHYRPACRALARDNRFGKLIFAITGVIQKLPFARRGVLRMVSKEQQNQGRPSRMSLVMWDLFTGSAPYRSVFFRTLHPAFLVRFLWEAVAAALPNGNAKSPGRGPAEPSGLGRTYRDREIIVRQGDVGECMFVIQAGKVEVLMGKEGSELCLAVLRDGDVFGEMALVDREVRSATVRALGEVRVLTVDKQTFLRRVHEDPSLAFRIVQKMSQRIRELDTQIARLNAGPRPTDRT